MGSCSSFASNHSMQLTPSRTAFTFIMIRISSLRVRKPLLLLFALTEVSCCVAFGGTKPNYAKLLIGDWEGPYVPGHALHQVIRRFHPDGRWGVVPYGGRPEEVMGREWRVEGDKLLLTYYDGRAFTPHTYQIISLTAAKLLVEIEGFTEEWDRVE